MDPFFAPEFVDGTDFRVRSYAPGDGPLLREATNSSFKHLAPWMPWAVRDQTDSEAEGLVRGFRGSYLKSTNFVLAVLSPQEDELLGGTGFHLRDGDLDSGNAEVGMWIRASRARQGLGPRVLRTLTRWGFEAWPWQRLVWRCDPENAASVRTAEKSGYTREALLRSHRPVQNGPRGDTLQLVALKDEWRDPGPPGREFGDRS